jgi:hypothetical protein
MTYATQLNEKISDAFMATMCIAAQIEETSKAIDTEIEQLQKLRDKIIRIVNKQYSLTKK